MRCFIAVDVDIDVKNEIVEFVDKNLIYSLRGVKWSKPENLHMTLAFLGDISEDILPSIGNALKKVTTSHAPFKLELSGLGFFPNIRNPKVIWLGVEKAPALSKIREELDNNLANIGLPRDKKPFNPHLTLGRVKTGKIPENIKTLDFKDSYLVKGINLIESRLYPQGPVYTRLLSCTLKK